VHHSLDHLAHALFIQQLALWPFLIHNANFFFYVRAVAQRVVATDIYFAVLLRSWGPGFKSQSQSCFPLTLPVLSCHFFAVQLNIGICNSYSFTPE